MVPGKSQFRNSSDSTNSRSVTSVLERSYRPLCLYSSTGLRSATYGLISYNPFSLRPTLTNLLNTSTLLKLRPCVREREFRNQELYNQEVGIKGMWERVEVEMFDWVSSRSIEIQMG